MRPKIKPRPVPKLAAPETFPLVELTGGPAGHAAELLIDGKKVSKVHRVEFVADVNEAIKVKVFQYAILRVKVRADLETTWDARLSIQSVVDGSSVWEDFAGSGPTVREAMDEAVTAWETKELPEQ